MSDEPAFPKPRPKDSAYREAAPAPAEPTKPKVVATRPVPPTEHDPLILAPTEEKRLAAEHLLVPMAAERTYWQKQQFIVRHPRITGAAFFVGSVVLLVPSCASRLEGFHYGASSTSVFGSVFLTTSLWLLVAGAPLRNDGRPPPWWSTGIVVCAVAGGLVGLLLLG